MFYTAPIHCSPYRVKCDDRVLPRLHLTVINITRKSKRSMSIQFSKRSTITFACREACPCCALHLSIVSHVVYIQIVWAIYILQIILAFSITYGIQQNYIHVFFSFHIGSYCRTNIYLFSHCDMHRSDKVQMVLHNTQTCCQVANSLWYWFAICKKEEEEEGTGWNLRLNSVYCRLLTAIHGESLCHLSSKSKGRKVCIL